MNVSLNSHFEDFVSQQLDQGRYNNASEVVRAGLRLLEERELKLKELRMEIEKGWDGETSSRSVDDIIASKSKDK